MAFLAQQSRALRGKLDRFLTGWTGEDFQELGVDRHARFLT